MMRNALDWKRQQSWQQLEINGGSTLASLPQQIMEKKHFSLYYPSISFCCPSSFPLASTNNKYLICDVFVTFVRTPCLPTHRSINIWYTFGHKINPKRSFRVVLSHPNHASCDSQLVSPRCLCMQEPERQTNQHDTIGTDVQATAPG